MNNKLVILQLSDNTQLRKTKVAFKAFLFSLSNNLKKLEVFLINTGEKVIDKAPEAIGHFVEGTGNIVKGLFGNKFGNILEDTAAKIIENKEQISNEIKGTIMKARDLMNAVAQKGGNFTKSLAEKIKGEELSEKENQRYQKIGEILTHIAIPGSTTVLGTLLFAIDADADGLQEIAIHDPEVLEALARSTNIISEDSTMEEITKYISTLNSEESLNGFVSNIKGILGEIEIVKELNENSNGIEYFLPTNTNNPYTDIYGRDMAGNIVETIQVKITENPNYVKNTLAQITDNTTVYVNSEMGPELKGLKNVIVTSVSEKDLESRVIDLLYKIKK